MKQTQVFVSLVMMVSFLITSCKAESIEPTPHIVGTAAAMAETIVAVQLTNIDEAVTETSTPTPKPTFTATPSLTFALPTLFPTQQANSGQSETETCLLAHMISETIPDNTEVEQGEFFEKTWVLQNTGSCTWTEQYSIVFSHGTRMGAPERVNFPGSVAPGESFTLKIPMIAPALAGEQTSFWYLESADGQHFGTRTSGVFWVRLVVKDLFASGSGNITDSKYQFDLWVPISSGSVLASGETNGNTYVGDSQHDYSYQGFITFDLYNIPLDATVTSVSLLFEGRNLYGTPFNDLGCMGIYRYNYGNLDPSDFYTDIPGGALWSFCSSGEVYAGAARVGGPDAVSAIQNSLGGKIQFRFQFTNDTDDDDVADYINLFPNLRVEYTTP